MSIDLIEELKQHLAVQPVNSSLIKLEKKIPGISQCLESCPGKILVKGMVSGSHNIGLKYEGELVSLLVMGSPRFNKKYKWELLRYCTKVGITVVGGASKLLSSFLKENPGTLISYADRRWSQGNLYKTLGFKEINRTAPSHSYVDLHEMIRLSTYKVRGDKIKRYIDKHDPRLTEAANMQLAGYERIFDCGSLVFTKE